MRKTLFFDSSLLWHHHFREQSPKAVANEARQLQSRR